MQETIKRILDGNFDYENGSLDFSCTNLEFTLHRGSVYEGSFRITSSSTGYTNGYITASDIRMKCLTQEFSGNDVEILFCFHGENMEEGDVVKGTFSIVSNRGEYSIPFEASVEQIVLESSVGDIKNLFHFANLAKSNWQEALKLFYSKEFYRVFVGSDEKQYDCYRALSGNPGNEQNMEEFLIQIHKKEKVDFLTDVNTIELELPMTENPYGVTETEVEITRNGWGYTALQIACEGNFVFTEKEFLTDDDFLGNHCRLPVYIDSSMCRVGKNWGKVIIRNAHSCVEIPVTVQLGTKNPKRKVIFSRKRLIIQLMELYEAFRLHKISEESWLKETDKLLENLVLMDENDIEVRLFQAEVLITEERYNEASWILDHVAELMEQEQMEDTPQWANYLYLTTLINLDEEYAAWVTDEVEQIYKKNRRDWHVAWILLYLSEEYNKSVAARWGFLEKQFNYGCSSPVLYIEALDMLNSNAALLRKPEGFGMQVLYFGAKQEMLGSDVIEQLLYLTGRVKEYSSLLEKTMLMVYALKPDERILQEICTLLIKGNKVGTEYFPWYEKGVEAQLRITNLYEYYMLSADLQKLETVPKILLMYFLYQNNLDYERTAFLYYYMLKHKNDYEDLYANYRPKIEKFVVDQIQKEHINHYLAGLYQEVLTPGIVTEQTASSLAKLLFAYQITVSDVRLHKVLVYQSDNKMPIVSHLQEGRAWIVLYGEDNAIAFEDAKGNRFVKTVDYTLERLMLPGKYLPMLAHYVKDSIGLDIYLCREEKEDAEITLDSAERFSRLIASHYVSKGIKRKAYMQLLKYYYNADDMRGMDSYLEQIPLQALSAEERSTVVRHMIRMEKNDSVYKAIEQFGPYFIEPKMLLYFADDMIRQTNGKADAILVATAAHAFRKGKYNSGLLQYLAKHFEGLTKDMRDIWKSAGSFEVERYELSERMLIQMLYSGAFVGEKMEIFREYVSGGAKHIVEEAVLAQCAYEFFVKEKLADEYVFKRICQAYSRGESVQWIAKLAFLKYYAENRRSMSDAIKLIAENFIEEVLGKKIYLNFLREYKEFSHLLREMQDKVVVEYRSRFGGKARIHYVMLHDNGDSEEYTAEYMKEVYPGVYFMDFVIFFGENLQYYIVEEKNGEEQLTESGSLQKSDNADENTGAKYEMINDMILSKTLLDYDTLDDLLEEYYCKEFLNRHLFHLQ